MGIIIESARRKNQVKDGGDRKRVDLDEIRNVADTRPQDVLELDEVLARLEGVDPQAAKLVKLRFFAGLTMPQAADALGISLRTAERDWTFARTWLHRALSQLDSKQ
jgi:RNA polymerase sigma factor (TIGR02999 family)